MFILIDFLVVLLFICCVTGRAAFFCVLSVHLRSADGPSLAYEAKLLTKKEKKWFILAVPAGVLSFVCWQTEGIIPEIGAKIKGKRL